MLKASRIYIGAAAIAAIFGGAARADDIKLCTGSPTGVYYDAGQMIASMAGKALKIIVVESGGTIDNMERTLDLAADDPESCDAMIGQPDGPVYLARTKPASTSTLRQVGGLHREYLHVLCNTSSGVDDLGDIADGKSKIAIGEPGSGAWLIWQNILAEDDSYSGVPVTSEGGILALASVSAGDTACMLVPAGLKNGIVSEADATYGDTIALVGANDKDFNDAVDIQGRPLYSYDYDIPGEAYPNSFNYWSDVETISWNAAVYVNTTRFDKKTLEAFATAVGRASAAIKAKYGK